MFIITVLSEVLLYFCFSILTGYTLLNVIAESSRPKIAVPAFLIYISAAGIPILAFLPVLHLVILLAEQIGIGITLRSVLIDFQIGQGWLITTGFSIFLLMFLVAATREKAIGAYYAALLCLIVIMFSIGWGSHASSLSLWKGFISHTFHVAAVAVWTGILLTIGFFAKETNDWTAFLKWFTPLAAVCVSVVIVSGIMVMDTIISIQQYPDTWMFSYGQTLLWKHLFLLPVLLFAFANGILIKKHLKDPGMFQPLPWLKAEGVLLFIMFALTGLLGQQSPPHDIESALKTEGASPLFTFFYGRPVNPSFDIQPALTLLSVSLFFIALLFSILIILSFVKKSSSIKALGFSFLLVITTYAAIIYSVQ